MAKYRCTYWGYVFVGSVAYAAEGAISGVPFIADLSEDDLKTREVQSYIQAGLFVPVDGAPVVPQVIEVPKTDPKCGHGFDPEKCDYCAAEAKEEPPPADLLMSFEKQDLTEEPLADVEPPLEEEKVERRGRKKKT